MFKIKGYLLIVIVFFVFTGVYNMAYSQNIIKPAFNLNVPDNWNVSLQSSTNIKITNPDSKFNFIGVNLEYIDKINELNHKDYLEMLAKNLPAQFENQFQGFNSGATKVYNRKETPVLLYTFKFNIPDTEDYNQVTQWIYIVDDYFLLTLFYTASEFSDSPSQTEVLSNISDSFKLKPAWASFASGLNSYFENNFSDALSSFETSLETEKNNSWLWYFTGLSTQAVHGLNKLDFSSNCFAKAATLDPSNLPALNQLSACFMAVDDLKKSHEILNDALNQNPFDEETLLNKTKLYLRQKDGDKAIETITLLVAKNPDSKEGVEIKNKLLKLRAESFK